MFSKLGNGLAGTWSSLDVQERLLLVYAGVCLLALIGSLAGAPARAEKKRREREELAELIVRRLGG